MQSTGNTNSKLCTGEILQFKIRLCFNSWDHAKTPDHIFLQQTPKKIFGRQSQTQRFINKTNLCGNIGVQGQIYKCIKQTTTAQWERDLKDSPKACTGAYSPTVNGSLL